MNKINYHKYDIPLGFFKNSKFNCQISIINFQLLLLFLFLLNIQKAKADTNGYFSFGRGYDNNPLCNYAMIGDNVNQGYLEIEYNNDNDSNNFSLKYLGGLMLFNNLQERNYYENSVAGFYKIKFTTRIDNEGIYYQFYPFHLREKKISWDEIDTIYVRKYKPIIEYGGWGIRIKPFKKDIAYNIWGNWGLQIEKSDGKRILLGTQRPEDIKRAILEIEGKL